METVMQKTQTLTSDEKAKAILQKARTFFNSIEFYVLETCLALAFVLTYQEVLGAIVFVGLIGILLVVCEDIMPTTLPFLLVSTFTTNCYDSYDLFMPYIIYAPIVVVCLIYHFVIYHKKFRFGDSVYGICAVSIAIFLGGVGNFPLMTYVKGAYYYLGLSLGMIVAHVCMKSQFVVRKEYDFRERFAWIMTLVGLLCVAMIATGYMRRIFHLPYNAYGQLGFSRNNLCTMMMFAMPFPLYLAKKKDWLVALSFLMYGSICITTSRGGLIFGSVEFAVCCLYWMLEKGVKADAFKLRLSICLIAVGFVMLAFGQVIADVIVNRLLADNVLEDSDRFVMVLQSFDRFIANPLFGSGILDNTISYGEVQKAGTMTWYHAMIPQVIGSMGLVGVAGYGFQIWDRTRAVFKNKCAWSLILGISYLGILLMSQVNPGEFCPVPFETLAVLLFIFQEHRADEEAMPLTLGKRVSRLP